jgi:hypothetical protein
MARENYEEVDVLRDPDGVVAVITRRTIGEETYHSFAIKKEFERDGKIERTSYLNRRHSAAVRRLLQRVDEYLDREVERSTARRATQRRGNTAG